MSPAFTMLSAFDSRSEPENRLLFENYTSRGKWAAEGGGKQEQPEVQKTWPLRRDWKN